MTSTDENEELGSRPTVDLSGLADLSFGPAWDSPGQKSGSNFAPREERRSSQPRHAGKPRDRRDRSAPRREEPRSGGRREHPREQDRGGRGPDRFEPAVRMAIYPADAPFDILAESIRASLKTYEIFDIARIILDKPDRFVVVFQAMQEGVKLYESVVDGAPFTEESAALAHAAQLALPLWFTSEEREVDPPKGEFQMVMRCPKSGRLLPPTSHHLFNGQLAEAHQQVCPGMALESYRRTLETVREPEVIASWLENMRKKTVFVLRDEKKPEGSQAGSFDSAELAIGYLRTHGRSAILKEWNDLRVPGAIALQSPDEGIRRSIEWYLEQQRHFPLETANFLRGKLRRCHFAIFKRGKKGVTYVTAVKRQPLPADAVFSPGLARIIELLKGGSCKVTELRDAFLDKVEPEAADKLLKQLAADLKWFKAEGYVLEYSNGVLELQVEQAAAPAEKKPAHKKPAHSSPKAKAVQPEDAPPPAADEPVSPPAAEISGEEAELEDEPVEPSTEAPRPAASSAAAPKLEDEPVEPSTEAPVETDSKPSETQLEDSEEPLKKENNEVPRE